MNDKPDFEALRAERNAGMQRLLEKIIEKHGPVRGNPFPYFDPNSCYCACPDGPCEHNFAGWRVFEDGNGGGGGETFCQRCGMGALAHTLRTASEPPDLEECP